MGEKEKTKNNKKQKHQHPNSQTTKQTSDFSFKPSSEVKGIRFGGQFIVKSFPIRKAKPLELLKVLSFPPTTTPTNKSKSHKLPFPSTTAFLPTNFTILAHQAWHTLTLGLGSKKSKVLVFVFETEAIKCSVDRIWPHEIALGDVNKKLIKGLSGFEMARFKFRKGCLTFYVYAVREIGSFGFLCAEDLKIILESVVELKDFLDHTVMLSMANQRSIGFSKSQSQNQNQVAMAH
ncbi:uncharacterized protein LOC131622016 [Vicia villosa]|uniref:uncharacterized protein LOC131622016 n=1 Tax=Vicia villosa TaxID=3911 RepID=UPI00273B7C87|nr:uncharacterized protein LOC131622016 [Vicia villosa]